MEQIKQLYDEVFVEASEMAVDFLEAIDGSRLDHSNEYKEQCSEDEETSLSTIAVCIWQAMVSAFEQEGVPMERRTVEALFDEIRVHHFG